MQQLSPPIPSSFRPAPNTPVIDSLSIPTSHHQHQHQPILQSLLPPPPPPPPPPPSSQPQRTDPTVAPPATDQISEKPHERHQQHHSQTYSQHRSCDEEQQHQQQRAIASTTVAEHYDQMTNTPKTISPNTHLPTSYHNNINNNQTTDSQTQTRLHPQTTHQQHFSTTHLPLSQPLPNPQALFHESQFAPPQPSHIHYSPQSQQLLNHQQLPLHHSFSQPLTHTQQQLQHQLRNLQQFQHIQSSPPQQYQNQNHNTDNHLLNHHPHQQQQQQHHHQHSIPVFQQLISPTTPSLQHPQTGQDLSQQQQQQQTPSSSVYPPFALAYSFLSSLPVRELRKIARHYKVRQTSANKLALIARIMLHIIETLQLSSITVDAYLGEIIDETFHQFVLSWKQVQQIPFPTIDFLHEAAERKPVPIGELSAVQAGDKRSLPEEQASLLSGRAPKRLKDESPSVAVSVSAGAGGGSDAFVTTQHHQSQQDLQQQQEIATLNHQPITAIDVGLSTGATGVGVGCSNVMESMVHSINNNSNNNNNITTMIGCNPVANTMIDEMNDDEFARLIVILRYDSTVRETFRKSMHLGPTISSVHNNITTGIGGTTTATTNTTFNNNNNINNNNNNNNHNNNNSSRNEMSWTGTIEVIFNSDGFQPRVTFPSYISGIISAHSKPGIWRNGEWLKMKLNEFGEMFAKVYREFRQLSINDCNLTFEGFCRVQCLDFQTSLVRRYLMCAYLICNCIIGMQAGSGGLVDETFLAMLSCDLQGASDAVSQVGFSGDKRYQFNGNGNMYGGGVGTGTGHGHGAMGGSGGSENDAPTTSMNTGEYEDITKKMYNLLRVLKDRVANCTKGGGDNVNGDDIVKVIEQRECLLIAFSTAQKKASESNTPDLKNLWKQQSEDIGEMLNILSMKK